ncbi:MAG: PAS domain-containing protein [Magnetospirillum sp.]|nr:PAS domain-containing protein [Magnetospirillum sp.]
MPTLNRFLATLVLAVTLPGLMLGAAAGWWIAHDLRRDIEREAAHLTEAVAGRITDHIRTVTTAMTVLGRSPSIETGDYAFAYYHATQLAKDLGVHIGLARPDGSQIFNSRRPFGTDLPRRTSAKSYAKALETGRPNVSGVIRGAIARTPLITVDVPVAGPAGPLVLGTSTDVSVIADILRQITLDPEWLAGIVDSEGTIIALTVDRDQAAGKPARAAILDAVRSGAAAGMLTDSDEHGNDMISFFRRVPDTGWTAVVCVPATILHTPLRQLLGLTIFATLAAVLATTALALALGGRLKRGAGVLTEAAGQLGRGAVVTAAAPELAEFALVADSLRSAGAGIRDREERLRLFTEIVPAGIAMFDRDMRYLAASRRFAEDFGIPLEGLLGRCHYDVFPKIPAHWKEVHRRCLAGATERCAEEPFPHADGTLDWVSWEIRPWHTGDGAVGGIVLASEVITERKHAEDQLRAAKADAERADLAKSKFLAAASHDLRQPVQSLTLLLEVLRDQAAAQPLAKVTALMEKSLAALGTLLNGILDISRLDADVVRPNFAVVEIGAVLARLAEEYRARGAEKGIAIRLLPATAAVTTDPALLERVLRNLIENALRYTDRGRVLIGIRRRGPMVRIDVVDTGIGIAAEHLEVIFDEFAQVGNAARDRSLGLGLGLSIVRRTVRLMGGQVDVASVPNKGSRFSVLLPAVVAPATAIDVVRDDQHGHGEAVLVIEDEGNLRQSLGWLLGEWGYAPTGVASGEAAEAAIAAGCRPAAIIADFRLETAITGPEAISRVRAALGAAIPAVILTGDTARERIKDLHGSGIALLHKPVSPQVLRQAVAAMVGAKTPGA